MSDVELVRGVLLSHGKLAEGMVDAVRRITGLDEGVLTAMSNDGQNPQGLADRVEALVGSEPVVVFADLFPKHPVHRKLLHPHFRYGHIG